MSNSSEVSNTFKHAAVYGMAGFFQKAIGFLMLPVYTHYLHGEGYGIYGMIEVVFTMLTVLVGYGIQGAMQRYYFTKESDEDRNTLVSTAIFSMFLIIFIVCTPAFLLRNTIAKYAFGMDGLEYYITLAIATFVADTSALNAQRFILIKKRSILFSLLSLSRFLLALILNIYLIVALKMGVLGVLYSGLITAVVFSVVVHSWVLNSVGFGFSKEDAKDIFKYSFPLIPGFLAMFIRNNASRIIIRHYLGLSELGVLSLISKFAALIIIFIHDPFMKIWDVRRLEICDKKSGPYTIASMFTVHFSLLLFMGLFLGLEIPVIVEVLTPDEFWVNGDIAGFAVLAIILLSCYYHLIFGIIYEKATYKISIIQITAAFAAVGANLLLIKLFGLLGAFMAEFVVNLIMCIMAYFLSKKYYSIPFEWNKILILIFTAFILFMIIDSISISKLGLSDFLNNTLLPFVNILANAVRVDLIKDGKFVMLLNEKFPIMVEGFLKAIFSLTFLISLFILKIIDKEQALNILKWFKFWERKFKESNETKSYKIEELRKVNR